MRLHDQHDNDEGDRVCRDCGEPFTVYASERKGYLAKGLEIPRRCKPCRAERRGAREAPMRPESRRACNTP